MTVERKPLVPLRINQEQPEFIRVPRFWTDVLFKHSKAIPASFWKFMLILWRGITNGNREYQTQLALSQFELTKAQASKWKAAVEASGLFKVETGTFVPRSNTNYAYRKDATVDEWLVWVKAINEKLELDKLAGIDPTQAQSFGLELTVLVDDRRAQAGLPRVHEQRIRECLNDGSLVTENGEIGSSKSRSKASRPQSNRKF